MVKWMVITLTAPFLLIATTIAALSQVNRPGTPAVQNDPPVRAAPSREEALEIVKRGISPLAGKGILRAEGNILVVKDPPKGWLKLPGAESGVVKEGEIVAVLDETTISTLFSSQRWLKVKRFCEVGVECKESTGWVYGGETDKPLFVAAQDPELITAVKTNRSLRRYVQGFAGNDFGRELIAFLESL